MTGVAFFDIDSFQLEEGVVATEYERPAPAPDYPIEIHSLNDFDVVSSVGGRNLLKGTSDSFKEINPRARFTPLPENSITPISEYGLVAGDTIIFRVYIQAHNSVPVNAGITYHTVGGGYSAVTGNQIQSGQEGYSTVDYTIPSNVDRLEVGLDVPVPAGSTSILMYYKEAKLEKGNKATNWAPTPEDITENDNHPLIDKINLLLDEPLRSVGDVKDRLYRDSDGLWKIERNVGEYIFDENKIIEDRTSTLGGNSLTNLYQFRGALGDKEVKDGIGISSHFNKVTSGYSDDVHLRVKSFDGQGFIPSLFFLKGTFSSTTEVSNWLKSEKESGRPVALLYVKNNPTIETLSQELQDKLNNLRSFKDSNYVYTIINNKTDIISENLKTTLHAIFKSSGWYNRWKTADELRKHQAEIDDKADNASTEESINNAIANIQVLQQELEAAATANELDDFIDKYNKDMAARNKDASQSEDNLSTALSSISMIEKDLGEMSETWKFVDRFIQNTPKGIVVGNESTGSYILIKEDRLSFFSNSQEVAFISQNLMEISRGAFVEQIQIAKYQFEESTNNHLTIRYVG